ncbi:methyltransferase domain-containing protein [Kitasatospora putterlickiae]|uniref:Methyltransferase domain-containing protein n=1 Tax=Kitasatospora putterlickiae TaxID=221725 RepID=A0ABN1YCN9_9ACTN
MTSETDLPAEPNPPVETNPPAEADPSGSPDDGLLARLDAADRFPGAERLRSRSYELLGAGPGRTVLDVGCGAGRAVAELAERGARAIGVDASARVIAAARRRRPGADLRVGDAAELPLPDRSVDGYRADKVFHELADPLPALAQARRLLVGGGRIVLLGQDWDTVVIDSDDPALTRALVHARADLVARPRAARRYRALLLDAGFADVAVEVRTIVLTGPAALPLLIALAATAGTAGTSTARTADALPRERTDRWIAEQRERAAADRLFLALPMFTASATAPR